MNLNIEELKLILLNGSLTDIKVALNSFDMASFDKNGSNILHYYVRSHKSVQMHAEIIIQLFMDFGIDVNAKQLKIRKRTALQLAVLMQSRVIFNTLLKIGADVNIQDRNGNVALFDAMFVYSRGDDGYFIKTLISNGANVDVMNNYGVSPKGLSETIANYDTKKFFL